jgi:hypothetical protein
MKTVLAIKNFVSGSETQTANSLQVRAPASTIDDDFQNKHQRSDTTASLSSVISEHSLHTINGDDVAGNGFLINIKNQGIFSYQNQDNSNTNSSDVEEWQQQRTAGDLQISEWLSSAKNSLGHVLNNHNIKFSLLDEFCNVINIAATWGFAMGKFGHNNPVPMYVLGSVFVICQVIFLCSNHSYRNSAGYQDLGTPRRDFFMQISQRLALSLLMISGTAFQQVDPQAASALVIGFPALFALASFLVTTVNGMLVGCCLQPATFRDWLASLRICCSLITIGLMIGQPLGEDIPSAFRNLAITATACLGFEFIIIACKRRA